MKPFKLMMQAFGPYAKKEVIDFTKLGNRTMFVISGKTGSGKTTIFDGISFAIYGKASGEDRNGSELRSQFAEDATQTEVSLKFSLRNQTYYIWRSPQQEKRKARGDGYTTVGAKAELYIINDEGNKQLLAANVRDVDEKIKEIIQLDANQFRQILMIPQGEFRKLLTSDSKDKEQILQRLFHTQLYKQMEEQLKDEATSLKKYVETKVEERSLALKSVYQTENYELKLALDEDVINDVKILTLLENEMLKMQQSASELFSKIEELKKERDEAKKKVDDAETLLNQFANRDRLKKEREELLSKKEFFDEMKEEIDKAYKASRLDQQDQLCHRIKKEYDSLKQDFLNVKVQLEQIHIALEKAEKQLKMEEEKSEERAKVSDDLIRITSLKDEVYTLAKRQQELLLLEKEYKEIEAKHARTKKQVTQMEDELLLKRNEQKKLEELQLEVLKSEKELDYLSNTVEKLTKLHSYLNKASMAQQISEEKSKLYENASARLEDARNTLSTIESKWQVGQASLLAKSLVHGAPCPVCGSTQHPNPTHSYEDFPTEKDLKSARNEVERLERENRLAETSMLEVKANLSHLQGAIEEQRSDLVMSISDLTLQNVAGTLNHYQIKQNEKSLQIKEKKTQVSQLSQIEKKIANIENKIKQERSNIEQFAEKEKELAKNYTEKNTSLQNSMKNIPSNIRKIEDYDQKVRLLINHKQQLERAFESANQQVQELKEKQSGVRASKEKLEDLLAKSEESLSEEREKFLSMLSEEGFSGYKQFSLAKRDIKTIKQLEQQVQNYREELRSVSDRYNEIVDRLSDLEPPQIDLLKQQFIDLEKLINERSLTHTNLLMSIRHNGEVIEKVKSINHSIKEAEEKYKIIGHLSDIARGQNTYRMTFERYVLASFLDDILQVANLRLTRMTSGRYHLLRKTDRSKGNIQSGLELLIFDQYTGQERHVKTLSGGESFKASLALALGLADVVQQHAGGVSLETMFIDEGFGTLDPESLDQAIESLMDIQNSGRLVGIISHVPELKERIDARLEVYTSQTGSTTQFQFIN